MNTNIQKVAEGKLHRRLKRDMEKGVRAAARRRSIAERLRMQAKGRKGKNQYRKHDVGNYSVGNMRWIDDLIAVDNDDVPLDTTNWNFAISLDVTVSPVCHTTGEVSLALGFRERHGRHGQPWGDSRAGGWDWQARGTTSG